MKIQDITLEIHGARQHPEKYLPIVIKKVLNGELLEIHSNPEQTEASKRCYLHNDDVSEAILFLMEKS